MRIMLELRELKMQIEVLRTYLHYLIEHNTHLISKEIVHVSQELDEILTKYIYIQQKQSASC